MDEVEALLGDAVEQNGGGGRPDQAPSHVRNDVGSQAGHGTGPLSQPILSGPMLLGALEHDLHAHADSQDRPAAGQAPLDEPRRVDCPQLLHDRAECAHPGYHESVGLGDLVRVAGEGHLRSDARQSTHRRADIAGSVGQDGDAWRLHVTYPTVPEDRSEYPPHSETPCDMRRTGACGTGSAALAGRSG